MPSTPPSEPTEPAERFADDAALVSALRAGDDRAFAWLLDRLTGPLARVARSYVPSGAVADEVVQDTWLAVITGIERFEGRSSLKTWIFGILVNVARTKGARERRSVPFASLASELDPSERAVDADRFASRGWWPQHWARPPASWDELPEARLTSREMLAAVDAAIATLPPNQQAVIRLRDVEGWPPEEVCRVLDVSEGNQRVLLHRARSKVRAALEAHLAHPEVPA